MKDSQQVTTGEVHTCCETSGGVVCCWGSGDALGLSTVANYGSGSGQMNTLPSLALDGSPLILSASSENSRTCGLMEDPMRFQCWGDGEDGGLGRGNTSDVGKVGGEVLGSTVGIEF